MICEVLPELPELPEHCQHASEHGGVHAYLRLVNGAAPPGKGGRLVAATVEDGPNLVLLGRVPRREAVRRGSRPSMAIPTGQASRARRWSPTRSALAMAVSAGFTAPMLGKKLVSTT